LKSGRILTSDILGTVALWDAVEGSASEGDDLDVDMAGEPEARSKPWKLKLADSINVKESNLPTTGENGSRSKQKSASKCFFYHLRTNCILTLLLLDFL
jgi:hypothetical protein